MLLRESVGVRRACSWAPDPRRHQEWSFRNARAAPSRLLGLTGTARQQPVPEAPADEAWLPEPVWALLDFIDGPRCRGTTGPAGINLSLEKAPDPVATFAAWAGSRLVDRGKEIAVPDALVELADRAPAMWLRISAFSWRKNIGIDNRARYRSMATSLRGSLILQC